MKEPVECTEVEIPNWRDETTMCIEHGETWPCKKVQRWRASKDYRIQQLEATVQRLLSTTMAIDKKVDEVRQQNVRLDLMVKGQLPALGDLLRGRTGGTLAHETSMDHQDFTLLGSNARVRVAGPTEFTVTYTDADGSVWKNGDLIEKVHRAS